jgi:uncharacterized protein (DUF302 family)
MAASEAEADPGIVTKISPWPVAETVTRLKDLLGRNGVKVFDVIDQSAEARRAGLSLRDTTLVIFGNPSAGTPVMVEAPLAALDLPLKLLIWDDAGRTKISYWAPAVLAARYRLNSALAKNLAAIDPLTDALVAG